MTSPICHDTKLSMRLCLLVRRLVLLQIGCTNLATYFLLLDGVLLGCGWNVDKRLGVGHDKDVRVPTAIKTGGRKIQSFRCSITLVVAITLSGKALVWGACSDRIIIKVPELVQALEFPRDVFARGGHRDTGGSVYPDNQYWNKEIGSLMPQMTKSKEKWIGNLSSQMKRLTKLMKKRPNDGDHSAAKPTSVGEHSDQEPQLLEPSKLMAENASLLAALKSKQVELEKYRHVQESQQAELEKYRHVQESQQAELEKYRRVQESQQAELEKYRRVQESKQVELEKYRRVQESQQVEHEKYRRVQESQKVELEKYHRDYRSLEAKFTKQRVTLEDLQTANSQLKQDFPTRHTTISMRALMHVADNIGELWSTLVIYLEIPPPKVHNIKATCSNIPHRALAGLHEWYSKRPENATKEALINALREIPCNDIADEILEM